MGKNDGALGAYRDKRDVRRSGEPSGSRRRQSRRPAFVVQKHGAYSPTRIRSGRDPGWLLVKKADRFAEPGSDPEQDDPESVKSGRDIEQVADEK